MRVASADGRAVLIHGEGIVDIAAASNGALPADPQLLYDHWDEVRALSERVAGGGCTARRARAAGSGAPPAPGVRHRPELRRPRGRGGPRAADLPADVHEVPDVSHRAGRDRRVAERVRRLGGRARGRDRAARLRGRARATDGGTSPASPSARTCPSGSCRPGPRRPSSASASRSPGSGRSGRGSSPPTSSTTPTTSRSAAPSTARRCRRAARRDLIFGVDALIHHLSSITPLLPGDLIFTGTPSGVGGTRTPPRFLAPGDELVSTIEGIGTIHTHLVDRSAHHDR